MMSHDEKLESALTFVGHPKLYIGTSTMHGAAQEGLMYDDPCRLKFVCPVSELG